ncbi:MAG: InlB B-repeat-containing protein [Treponema sp.]|jgi:uncharacterized repeat protein (TIGR02543 family)|nr:InlB B-repeat-containing protein [Treponema sp.]
MINKNRNFTGFFCVFAIFVLLISGCLDQPGESVDEWFTITWNSNGGTGYMADITERANTSVNMPSASFTRTGFTFVGWNTAANGTGSTYAAGSPYTLSENITMYAMWTSNPVVTYNGNGHTGGTVPATQTGSIGLSITLAAQGTLEKTGYIFTGWNTLANGSGNSYTAGSSYIVTGSVTMYAQWGQLPPGVTYNGNGSTGGTAPSYQMADPGSSITLPLQGTLVKTGNIFRGWNTAADGSGISYAAGSSYTVTDRDILYANWAPPPTVTYNGNGNTGGTAPAAQSMTNFGLSVTLASVGTLVKTGYTFSGWNTAADGSGYNHAAGSSYTVNDNVTMYAKWQEIVGARIGIITFGGAVTILQTTPELLTSSNYSTLGNNINFVPPNGNAPIYGVHKALEHLRTNENLIPANVHSVNLITFTASEDGGSMLLLGDDETLSSTTEVESEDEYAGYVKNLIDTRTIRGKNINAYSIGLNVSSNNNPNYTRDLDAFRSDDNQYTSFSSVSTSFLTEFASKLSISNTDFYFRIPANWVNGTTVIITFSSVSGPSPSYVDSAAEYLKGTLVVNGTNFTLTDIDYPQSWSCDTQRGGTITGVRSGLEVTFTFHNVSGYTFSNSSSTTKQFYKLSAASYEDNYLQYASYTPNDTSVVTPRNSVVYLVLDCRNNNSYNSNLRSAVSNFLYALRNRYPN